MTQTTFPITANTDDQYVQMSSASYPPSSTVFRDAFSAGVYVERYNDGTNYIITHGLLRWDTSSLAGQKVTAATLRVVSLGGNSTDGRSFVAGWAAWDGTSASDYSGTALTDAHAGTLLNDLATSSQSYDLALTGATQNVSTTGYTYMKCWVSGGQPSVSSSNYMGLAAFENTATEPQLVVTHFSPTRIAPDAILSQTNLTGAVSVVQDDPDSPDANWLTAP